MTEQELKLYNITEQAKKIEFSLQNLSFRLMRTKKNINSCKEACQTTNKIIGEINDRHK